MCCSIQWDEMQEIQRLGVSWKMKGKSWTNQNFTSSLYDNECPLPSFSEQSSPFFQTQGQRKCQSNRLLVWTGWKCKERKIVQVRARAALILHLNGSRKRQVEYCSRLQGHISHYHGYAEGRVPKYRYHSPVCSSKCCSFHCLSPRLFLIATEYAELQMLLFAVFFLIPRVIYSFPSCKNNLFIPFLSPAWDGSHFPRSLWFYHNCLPTYVHCLSYRVLLLQKAAKQFSPAAEKWWSGQKSLYGELIARLPTNSRESRTVS